jgi:tRNA threonylcarbamoyladenosine biosynthesis protein TsaE
MRELGRRIASLARPGDVIVLSGELGAGKTTLVQGIGAGLGVAEQITSPTFVIARVHRGERGPSLVHVDAYRVANAIELDDLDLDADLASSVTVVEWGEGRAERLSNDRLLVRIERPEEESDERRTVTFTGVGDRWSGVSIESLLGQW